MGLFFFCRLFLGSRGPPNRLTHYLGRQSAKLEVQLYSAAEIQASSWVAFRMA